MDKPLTKILIFTGLAVAVGGVFVAVRANQNPRSTLPLLAATVTPSPSQETRVQAPNGEKTLVMKEKKDEGTVTYTFSVSGKEGSSRKEIFTKTLPQGGNLSIPYNTFSPDNKYVFLKETAADSVSYFVLSEDGSVLNISDLLEEKYTDYLIADVTGWGGTNLVIVNTDKSGGGMGPSFWFDVASRSFIQLSSRF